MHKWCSWGSTTTCGTREGPRHLRTRRRTRNDQAIEPNDPDLRPPLKIPTPAPISTGSGGTWVACCFQDIAGAPSRLRELCDMGPKTFWPSRGQTLTPSASPSLSLSLSGWWWWGMDWGILLVHCFNYNKYLLKASLTPFSAALRFSERKMWLLPKIGNWKSRSLLPLQARAGSCMPLLTSLART